MGKKYLLELADQIILSVGDVIVDLETDQVGVLVTRHRHIVLDLDEVYVWDVYWGNPDKAQIQNVYKNLDFIEEDFLKFSVAAGMFDHYSKGGKSEP